MYFSIIPKFRASLIKSSRRFW